MNVNYSSFFLFCNTPVPGPGLTGPSDYNLPLPGVPKQTRKKHKKMAQKPKAQQKL